MAETASGTSSPAAVEVLLDLYAAANGSGWRDARRERRAVEGDAVDGEGEHGYLGSWRQSVRPLE